MAKTICQNRIRVIMAEKRLTNSWLAEQMELSDITISRWRSNKMQPSIAQLAQLADVLKVDVKDLLEVIVDNENEDENE